MLSALTIPTFFNKPVCLLYNPLTWLRRLRCGYTGWIHFGEIQMPIEFLHYLCEKTLNWPKWSPQWVLLPLFGRRIIYLWSLILMFGIMTLIGALGVQQARSSNPGYSWAIGSILIVSSFLSNYSIGPLCNTLCSDISSSLLRNKSLVLARWTYLVFAIVASVLTPCQLNFTAWNWSAKTGFFWAGGCLIGVVFTFFCVPEPKGRTTAEMNILFERRVPARAFSKTKVDLREAVNS